MKKEPKEPEIFPLDKLPRFIQILVFEMWEKNGTKPADIAKNHDPVFTYFKGIYSARMIHTDLFMHESVHYIRQGSGEDETKAKDWWLRYCSDPIFRYEEEVLAYREQLKYIKGIMNRSEAFKHAKRLASELSGPMYGNLHSFERCMQDIIKK